MTDFEDEEVIRSTRTIKDVQKRRLLKILGLIFVVLLAGTITASLSSYLTLRGAAEDGTILAQQIQEQCNKPGLPDPDLAQFCPSADKVVEAAPSDVKTSPVPGPPGPTGSTGPEGETGQTGEQGPAPSDAQVLEAVRSFCTSTGACRGDDGGDATPAQVAIAVASYCNNRGECRGPAGTNGADGSNGANGTNGTNGKDAQPVTQAQIMAAVSAYCDNANNCRGPAGADGKDGADSTVPGPQGPAGVAGVVDNCDPAPAGQVISDVTPSYNPDNQTVIISCSYKDDDTGGILQNGSNP